MSKIGKKLINIPQGVSILASTNSVSIKNSNGDMEVPLFSNITIQQNENTLSVLCDSNEQKAKHGLVRSLIANSIEGITQGFEKKLILKGVGFKAVKKGNNLHLTIGFSHEVIYKIPDSVEVKIPEPTKIHIRGIDKQKVGQVAADIKRLKKADPYKGKGIFLEGETIKRKVGKSAKK